MVTSDLATVGPDTNLEGHISLDGGTVKDVFFHKDLGIMMLEADTPSLS